jgi:hypothetical protein
MSNAFYKTSDPTVLAAMAAYEADGKSVAAVGGAFAEHFGGRLLTSSTVHGREVAGLYFRPAKDDPLWTKPDAERAGMQRPRGSLRKGTKEERHALANLQADWKARFPAMKADLAPVLAAMGTDWGALFFSGFAMFQHDDGVVYVATSAQLATCMVEIRASEYNAARIAYESVKEAA